MGGEMDKTKEIFNMLHLFVSTSGLSAEAD